MVERVGVCVWGGGFVRRARGGTSYTQAQNEGIAVKTSTEETDNLLLVFDLSVCTHPRLSRCIRRERMNE